MQLKYASKIDRNSKYLKAMQDKNINKCKHNIFSGMQTKHAMKVERLFHISRHCKITIIKNECMMFSRNATEACNERRSKFFIFQGIER